MDEAYVFAAYLKNSVTSFVEPLSVMAWRVGADFCLCFAANGILRSCRVDESERRVDNASVTSLVPHRPKSRLVSCASEHADRCQTAHPSMSFVSFSNIRNPSANVLNIKQHQPPPVVDLELLQAGSMVLQEQLLKDTQIIPDHGEMFAYSVYL